MGGEAVANGDNVSSCDGAEAMIRQAIDTFGDLHVVVNNAGILRDRVLANMTEEEWDAVIAVHLKGTFAPSRHAAAYWREQAKAGKPVSGRIINTTSVSGIYGNPGQTNYGAAKAGIAAFTNIAAMELPRYGVTVNAVGPVALTRMTEGLGPAPETDEAARGPRPALDRPDRHVAGVGGVGRRHRPRVRGVGPGARRRRGLGPRPVDDADRRPDADRRRRRQAARRRPPEQRHGRQARFVAADDAEVDTTAMPLNPAAVGATSEPAEFSWTSKDALLYAVEHRRRRATSWPFTTENTAGVDQQVFPTFPVVHRVRRRRAA